MSNDDVGRQAEILEKMEACKSRIRETQARIDARRAAGQATDDDEKRLAIELDFLSILEDVLKTLQDESGSPPRRKS